MAHAAGQPVPLCLEYRAEPSAGVARRGWRVASLLALLPGLIVPFVPFACDVSPVGLLAAAGEQLLDPEPLRSTDEYVGGLVGLTAFLAFPLVAWGFLRLRPGGASRHIRAVFVVLAAIGNLAALTVLGFVAVDIDATNAWEWSLFGTSAALLCFTLLTIVRLSEQRRGADQRITAALAGPYAAVLVLFLPGYAMGAQIGWFLALTPTAAAVAELLAATAFALRRPARRIPD